MAWEGRPEGSPGTACPRLNEVLKISLISSFKGEGRAVLRLRGMLVWGEGAGFAGFSHPLHEGGSAAGSPSPAPERSVPGCPGVPRQGVKQKSRVRGESVASSSWQFLKIKKKKKKRSFKMNQGKLEREFTWYLRDFLCFTNILSFLLKKPLGGLEGRREKVRPCARLLGRKSGPIPLISVEPLWICQSAEERAPSAAGVCVARGGRFRTGKAEKRDELGFSAGRCAARVKGGVYSTPRFGRTRF